jgi:hypothetical protein
MAAYECVTSEKDVGKVRVSDRYGSTVSCLGMENSQTMQSGPQTGLIGDLLVV